MLPFKNISQLVAVEPSAQYRLEFYVRIEDLKTGGPPLVQIFDGADEATVLASSPPLPNGTFDWQAVTMDFKTPPKSEAVIMRVVRAPCGTDSVCPIFGIVWYDDFNLQRINGSTGASDNGKAFARNPSAR
jgi:hypothetical protein